MKNGNIFKLPVIFAGLRIKECKLSLKRRRAPCENGEDQELHHSCTERAYNFIHK